MQPTNLALRTDAIFHRFAGEVLDRGDYLVIRTPDNPDYWSGNALLLPGPPGLGDAARWNAWFEREFPGAPHRAYTWDGDLAGDTSELTALGFDLSDNPILATTTPLAARPAPPELAIRPLAGDDDWRAVLDLNAACDDRVGSSEMYDRFRERSYAAVRAMTEAGLGTWLGGFVDHQLVGQLGIFAAGDLARYNSVETHPDFRRRGICSALVVEACRLALDQLGAHTVVIVADPDSAGERVYTGVGFTEVGREHLAIRKPRTD